MKRIVIIYFLLLLCLPLTAQQTYRARVVDAETGEALPYVTIHTASGKRTITNSEGYFVIETEPKEQLSFRYIGYETKQMTIKELGNVVRMKPYSRELGEVVVQGFLGEDILRRMITRLVPRRVSFPGKS